LIRCGVSNEFCCGAKCGGECDCEGVDGGGLSIESDTSSVVSFMLFLILDIFEYLLKN
jgi:hypothetical protein